MVKPRHTSMPAAQPLHGMQGITWRSEHSSTGRICLRNRRTFAMSTLRSSLSNVTTCTRSSDGGKPALDMLAASRQARHAGIRVSATRPTQGSTQRRQPTHPP